MCSYGCHRDCTPLITVDTEDWDSPQPVAKNGRQFPSSVSGWAQMPTGAISSASNERMVQQLLSEDSEPRCIAAMSLDGLRKCTCSWVSTGGISFRESWMVWYSSILSPLLTHIDGTTINRKLMLGLYCIQSLLSFWFKNILDPGFPLLSGASHLNYLSLNWNLSKW